MANSICADRTRVTTYNLMWSYIAPLGLLELSVEWKELSFQQSSSFQLSTNNTINIIALNKLNSLWLIGVYNLHLERTKSMAGAMSLCDIVVVLFSHRLLQFQQHGLIILTYKCYINYLTAIILAVVGLSHLNNRGGNSFSETGLLADCLAVCWQ